MSVVAAAPAQAAVAVKVKITNALGDWLQVSELQAFTPANL